MGKSRSSWRRAILLIGAGIVGCSERTPVESGVARPDASVVRARIGRVPTIRDEFLALEGEIPGFSTMHLDAGGRINVRTTGVERARTPEALERLASFARRHGVDHASAGQIRIVPARFSYRQLDSTMHALASGAWRSSGVVGYGVNETTGQIEVHVESPQDSAAIQRATPTGVIALLDVIVSGRPQSLQANLHQRSRPLDNGFQIS